MRASSENPVVYWIMATLIVASGVVMLLIPFAWIALVAMFLAFVMVFYIVHLTERMKYFTDLRLFFGILLFLASIVIMALPIFMGSNILVAMGASFSQKLWIIPAFAFWASVGWYFYKRWN